MTTIQKFTFRPSDCYWLSIPCGFRFLAAAIVGREYVIWAEVDLSAGYVPVQIFTLATGQDIPAPAHQSVYVGTLLDGCFPWHVYYRVPAA